MIGECMLFNGGVTDAWLWAPGEVARAGEWAGVRWGEVGGLTTGTDTEVRMLDVGYSAYDVDCCTKELSPLDPSTVREGGINNDNNLK